MIDLSLLRALRAKADYDKFRGSVPLDALEARTQVLVLDIDKYYKAFPEHEVIDFVLFKDMFFGRWHKSLDTEQTHFYNKTLDRVDVVIQDDVKASLINSLIELKLGTDLGNILTKYTAGDDIDLLATAHKLTENAADRRVRKSASAFEEPDFGAVLQSDADDSGFKWRLNALNKAMRPLRGGDSVIIAGRPDTGKSSFVASEGTYMAAQAPVGRPIVWFSNEGSTDSIVRRSLNTALGIGTKMLVQKQADGTLRDDYASAIGRIDNLQIVNIVGWTDVEVKDYIEAKNPSGVILDMVDKITFLGMGRDARTDQVLEEKYASFRDHAILNDYFIMHTSQLSGDAEGLEFPELHMLKDSKTGKQGACDVCLYIGKSLDFEKEDLRYLSTPKNKLAQEGCKNPLATVTFNGNTGRYKDMAQ